MQGRGAPILRSLRFVAAPSLKLRVQSWELNILRLLRSRPLRSLPASSSESLIVPGILCHRLLGFHGLETIPPWLGLIRVILKSVVDLVLVAAPPRPVLRGKPTLVGEGCAKRSRRDRATDEVQEGEKNRPECSIHILPFLCGSPAGRTAPRSAA